VEDARPPLPAPLREGLEDYLLALRVEAGLARRTLSAYRSDLERALAWFGERGCADWAALGPEDVVDFLAARRAGGAAEATVAHDLTALRMLCGHLVAERRLARDPCALLRAPVLLSASADKPQPLKKAGGSWYRPCIRCGKLIHVRRLSCDCGLSVVRVEEPA